MCEKTRLFVGISHPPFIGDMVSLIAEFSDCISNRVIKATVQGPELVNLKRSVALVSEICNRLAEIAVVVDYLIDRESEPKEFMAVLGRRCPNFRHGDGTVGGAGDLAALQWGSRLL